MAGVPVRAVAGLKVAICVAASYDTTPITDAPAVTARLNVAVVIVKGSIGSLNVTLTVLLTQTPTAPSPGLVELTVGGVVSGATPVVKLHV